MIHSLDTTIARLEAEMADPDVAGDYLRLNDKCTEYEQAKAESAALADEWLMLLDEE